MSKNSFTYHVTLAATDTWCNPLRPPNQWQSNGRFSCRHEQLLTLYQVLLIILVDTLQKLVKDKTLYGGLVGHFAFVDELNSPTSHWAILLRESRDCSNAVLEKCSGFGQRDALVIV